MRAICLNGSSTRSNSVGGSRRATPNSRPTTWPSSNSRLCGYGCALINESTALKRLTARGRMRRNSIKKGASGAPFYVSGMISELVEAAAGMGQHRVDLAGIRRQIGITGGLVLAASIDFGEQFLEIDDVTVDR